MTACNLYIIAGPNGAGKTTFARKFLPRYAKCLHFVNADLIAHGLAPFSSRGADLKAGRILLDQIRDLAGKQVDFAFETTLSGRTYVSFLKKLRDKGYQIHLFFLWIPNVELALARIRDRVAHGGHDVPPEDVRRRFGRSIHNLIKLYRPLLDSWYLFDNSTAMHRLITKERYGKLRVFDEVLYMEILNQLESKT